MGLIYSLLHDNILDWTKLKAFSDDEIRASQKMKFMTVRVENIAGKGRKCWLSAFSPFPKMFSRAFFLRAVKTRYCVVKGFIDNR